MTERVDRGRRAFERQAWSQAYTLFTSDEALVAADLERLAVAAHLVGRDVESAAAWERAYKAHLRDGKVDAAARCAFWLGMGLLLRGELAKAGGWLSRGERLVEEAVHDCAAHGLLLVPVALEALNGGDPARAAVIAHEVIDVGRRFGDPDVLAFGLFLRGRRRSRRARHHGACGCWTR